MDDKIWLNWAIELQSLAQAGLTYGKDVYDRERYERIREISAEMISHKSEIPVEIVKNLFCNETGYHISLYITGCWKCMTNSSDARFSGL